MYSSRNSKAHLESRGPSPCDRTSCGRRSVPGHLPSAPLRPPHSLMGGSLPAFFCLLHSPRSFPGMICSRAPALLVLNILRKFLNPSLFSPKATVAQTGYISSSHACWGPYSVEVQSWGHSANYSPWTKFGHSLFL